MVRYNACVTRTESGASARTGVAGYALSSVIFRFIKQLPSARIVLPTKTTFHVAILCWVMNIGNVLDEPYITALLPVHLGWLVAGEHGERLEEGTAA